MPKEPKPYLSAAIKSTLEIEELAAAVREMSEKMAKSVFAGAPGAGSFTGLRSILAHPQYPFGTVLKYRSRWTPLSGAHGMVIGPHHAGYIKVMVLEGDREGTVQTVPLDSWLPEK